MQYFKRIALLGAIANPNVGDEAILCENLKIINKIYGNNCKVYVFSKEAAFTSLYSMIPNIQIVPVDYLHRITLECNYDEDNLKKVICKIKNNILYDEETLNALKLIFEDIDILHIIGGGYINSLWPDMMYEVYIATLMARKYRKKYLLTGVSLFPLESKNRDLVQEICEYAEKVDLRDEISQQYIDSKNSQVTCDDAIYLEDMYRCDNNIRYANIVISKWNYNPDELGKVRSSLIEFMKYCLDKQIVDYFNIIEFSKGDFDFWNNADFEFGKGIKKVSLITTNSIWNKHVISNALFNIGTRFHMAVFSLSESVPVLSLYSSDLYYENKIKSIHELYKSSSYCTFEECTFDTLVNFASNLGEKKQDVELADQIYDKYRKKIRAIAKTYAENRQEENQIMEILGGNSNIPKVSVIIPIYNMDRYLRECLDSVLNQTLKEIEIICINDGSTDYSQTILNEYEWNDSRIINLTQVNHGVAYSRNRGIQRARGEFLYFLDPDDWLPENDILAYMYNAAKKNKALIVGGGFKEYGCTGITTEWPGNLCKYSFKEEGFIEYNKYQFDYGWTRFIYDRKLIVYNNLEIPNYKFYEDPVFFVRVMHKAGKFYALTRETYCYRTGYKSTELSYEKTVDLLKGIGDNIEFAIENNYDTLLALEVSRLENDYGVHISKYMMKENSTLLRNELERINLLFNSNNNRIEYRIYNRIIENKEYEIWNNNECFDRNLREKERGIQERDNRICELESVLKREYNSLTWRIGNFFLFIPKQIRKRLKKNK